VTDYDEFEPYFARVVRRPVVVGYNTKPHAREARTTTTGNSSGRLPDRLGQLQGASHRPAKQKVMPFRRHADHIFAWVRYLGTSDCADQALDH
jgi:hypothetical protein